jgi:integrase
MTDNMRGIQEFADAAGRRRFRVRLRRRGQDFSARFEKLGDAIRYRDAVLDALAGHGDMPELPKPVVPASPGRAVTVEDCARRLCVGMREGSVRTNRGQAYKPSVLRKYEEALRVLVIPEIGAVPVATLTRGDVQRLVDAIAAQRTPEHARKALVSLRVSVRLAERYGDVEGNVCAGVRVPASAEAEQPPRVVTPEEASAIVAQADADDARLMRSYGGPLISLAFGTGLRLGELLALQWGADGLDLDARVVRVRRSLDRVRDASGEYPFIPPKSRASRRDVPLTDEDVARLRRHRLATGRRDGELVFGGDRGEALSPVPAARAFRRACFRAGVFTDGADAQLRGEGSYVAFQRACRQRAIELPLPRFHDCRHAFASHLLAAGVSAHAVAELMGHSDATLVMKRYGHAMPDELARAGDVLSAWRAARS